MALRALRDGPSRRIRNFSVLRQFRVFDCQMECFPCHLITFLHHISGFLRHIAKFLDNGAQFKYGKELIGGAARVGGGAGLSRRIHNFSVHRQFVVFDCQMECFLCHRIVFLHHTSGFHRHIGELLDNGTQFKCGKGLIGSAARVGRGAGLSRRIHNFSVLRQFVVFDCHIECFPCHSSVFLHHIG